MKNALSWRQSPALIIAVLALVAAVAGAAIASPTAHTAALTKKKVRKIADKEIAKKASGLSVASAASATNATTAGSANPVMFAQISADGAVQGANSKGISGGNVTHVAASGFYCFKGLSIKGGQAIVDWEAADADETAQFGLGDASGNCPAGTVAFVQTFVGDGGGTPEDDGIFVHLYN